MNTGTVIYEDSELRIETEPAEIPWLKIFAKPVCKEMSQCSPMLQAEIFRVLMLIEKEMLAYFAPDKINIASFGNMLPQVHWHVMARFATDSYFPEPMWGTKQREAVLDFPPMEGFVTRLQQTLVKSGGCLD